MPKYLSSLTFIPQSFPDQTLFSWIWMYHRMSGNASISYSAQQLLGATSGKFHFHIPSHLDRLCLVTEGLLGSPEQVIQNMTVLPAYLWFRTDSLKISIIEKVRSPNVAGVSQTLRLWDQRDYGAIPARCCPCCISADRVNYGMAYWHRKHQLPGVVVCTTHGDPLYSLPVGPRLANVGRRANPEHVATQGERIQVMGSSSIDGYVRIAEFSEALAQSISLDGDWVKRIRANCITALYRNVLIPDGEPLEPTRAIALFQKELYARFSSPDLASSTIYGAGKLLFELIMGHSRTVRAEDYPVLLGGLFESKEGTGLWPTERLRP